MGAPDQQQAGVSTAEHSNGVVVTPLPHDDEQLPPSVPSGYPQNSQQGMRFCPRMCIPPPTGTQKEPFGYQGLG